MSDDEVSGRRRKIRKIIENKDLALTTQEATNNEYIRKKRIDEQVSRCRLVLSTIVCFCE